MCLLLNIIFEFIIYLIVDNITKFCLLNTKKVNRFDIFIYECLFFGFLIGFISVYHHITFILIIFLLIHIVGIIYTEKRVDLIKNDIKLFIEILIKLIHLIFRRLYNSISNYWTRRSNSKVLITKKLPEKYLYSFYLKPTNDLRLQQSCSVQSLSRPGIFNLHGTTCSLNALLQSLASLDSLYKSFQRNISLSRFNYDPIVPTFLDLIFQLRADHRTTEYKLRNTLVDTSAFISKLKVFYPDLLTINVTTDIAELFQCIIDVLNNALSKQTLIYSRNVTEQVQNQTFTTFSLAYLNRIFIETESQLHNQITLDNIDAKTSYIIRYIDLTWLLHHIQLSSIVKQMFSGQMLHAYCCKKCSHVRFRTEPFQILTVSVSKTSTTLERIISQLTKIENMDSISCSYCSNQHNKDHTRESTMNRHGTMLTTITPITSSLSSSSLVNTSGQSFFNQNLSSRSISTNPTTISTTTINLNSYRTTSQTFIANFPFVLCIQLKRFSYDCFSRTTTKLNTNIFVEPEKILDLSQIHYTTWLGLTNVPMTIPASYRLIAICLHLSKNSHTLSTDRSNSTHGHYVSLYRTNNSRWFLCDDEHITEINDINNFCHTSYVTENSYLLFYERCL